MGLEQWIYNNGAPRPLKMGHLPQKSEKMQSHQIKLKIGIDTNSSTRITKIRVLTLENNRKLEIGNWKLNNSKLTPGTQK